MLNFRTAFARGLVAVAVFLACASASRLYAQGAQEYQEYVVQFRDGTPPAARRAAAAAAGAAVRFVYNGVAGAAVRVPNAQVLAALRRNPAVVAIVPNRPVSAYQQAQAKNGKGGGGRGGGGGQASQVIPAGVARVGGISAASDGAGVGVAIVDTGVDLAHADLFGTVDAYSAFGASCQDDAGHGTHVAGTVAARNNGLDVVGVAPAADIFCVKVLDATGSGTDATVMAGLDWVLSNHASVAPAIRVVNMSLGRPGSVDDNPLLRDLVAALDGAGVSIVAAAGNEPSADVSEQIPAAYPAVIAVASTTALDGSNQCRFLEGPIQADTASYFTTDGTGVVVSAPGEKQEDVNRGCLIRSIGILSTKLGGGTTRMSGTSMASPHVAGIVARHYQQDPAFTPLDIRSWLPADAARPGIAPLDSPTSSYTFDGVREGIAQAPPDSLDP
jgi:subtilisin